MIPEEESRLLRDELQNIGHWNFNTIKLEQITRHNSIVYLGDFLFQKKGFIEFYSLDSHILK